MARALLLPRLNDMGIDPSVFGWWCGWRLAQRRQAREPALVVQRALRSHVPAVPVLPFPFR
jgi:hypothetical protein